MKLSYWQRHYNNVVGAASAAGCFDRLLRRIHYLVRLECTSHLQRRYYSIPQNQQKYRGVGLVMNPNKRSIAAAGRVWQLA
jgi:hypothetical protein